MKLESFKDKKVTKRMTLISLGIITIVGVSLLLYKTFASFSREVDLDNDNVLFGFYNGETKLDEMPQKGNSNNLEFEKAVCDNGASIEWDSEKWAPLVKGLTKTKTKCTLYFSENKFTGVDLLKQRAEEEQAKPEPELMYDDTDDRNLRYVGANPNNYIDIGNRYRSDIYSIYNLERPFGEYSSYEECTASITYEMYGGDAGASCKKTHSKGEPILWRIIGVMNNMINVEENTKESLIKIVRADDIGQYSFDLKYLQEENYYLPVNDYSQANLMKLLNDGYKSNSIYNVNEDTDETINNSLYWNSEKGKCIFQGDGGTEPSYNYFTENCDFTNNGLESTTQNKFAKVRWNLGAVDSSLFEEDENKTYFKKWYEAERSNNIPCGDSLDFPCTDGFERNITWDGYIGLMYQSDYGYAVGGNYRDECLNSLMMEGSEKCDDNWLKKIEIGENDSICTVTPYLYYGNSVVLLGTDSVGYGITLIVYPTAFLKSSVSITDAAGTQDDPFVVS